MKNSTLVLLLFALILMTGNTQAQSSDSIESRGQNRHGHGSQGKRNGHHKEIRLFHRHHQHQGKSNSLNDGHSRSHHGNKAQGERKAQRAINNF